MNRYLNLSDHLKKRFGRKVWKIPLDAGFSCPNRDGTISRKGCAFCNPSGSGSGLREAGMKLGDQWEHWRIRMHRKRKAGLFLAYLQSFTNTHGTLDKIRDTLDQIRRLKGLAGVSLGTRPDCLDPDRLELLADFPVDMFILEVGLQSSNDKTLERINRGHDAACFARATLDADRRGLEVCAHVVAGLPGENEADLSRTIDFVNDLPIRGIKLHNLYVCRGTEMERMWRTGQYAPLERRQYANWVARAVSRLRPDIVIHRLNGDPVPGELLAPDWAGHKSNVLQAVKLAMEDHDTIQGRDCISHGC